MIKMEVVMKKNITFIYMDAAEKAIYAPIAKEAKKRGYKVRMTDNKFAKCEIGFYCQHVNFPQYSKFSVIMLHDIIQQYGNWPDLWIREPWNKYDIGFLPSNQWVENWNKCSQYYYANPKIGMYKIGWPKADNYVNIDRERFKKEFSLKYGLDLEKKTVLYAPAWENDGKQDDFVKAMLKLDVNILIKQVPVNPDEFKEMYDAINEMYELHKGIPKVTILDPKTNIFEAIMAADILVSEESSTMCEATLMGVPAISVSNWLIPDVTPKRYPACNYSFVFMTTKEKLTDFVSEMLDNYKEYVEKTEKYRNDIFGECGVSSKIIMDILDDCVKGKKIRHNRLKPAPRKKVPFNKMIFHIFQIFKRNMLYNYGKRYKVVGWSVDILRRIKKTIVKK